MIEEVSRIQAEALAAIQAAASTEELKALRVRYLGKKAELSQLLGQIGRLPPEERRAFGAACNQAREAIEAALREREEELRQQELAARLEAERIDVTLPGTFMPRGHLHVLRQVWERFEEIFIAMGYEVYDGPEVETDWYNFEALNIPKGHPARDAQDSFFVSDEVLLRTHTSPCQIRYMQSRAPALPVRVIVPGRVYRRDFEDATHSAMFHQVEALVLDRGITMGDLKGTLLEMARALFGPETQVRLRPSYFPFTEPSAEVDVTCIFCRGAGCRVCKGEGWIEILGAGMVHPTVIRNGGYDPEEVTGFAFGVGLERVAMLMYGIEDIRHFFNNDLRFLRQF
ncbi:MAG: phenylalanine--tRNA ligase subunit alpha [Bacillota bacterium]|nr:MAG: phenylalanine--tRNA ligase subunit alpha [Bacillota bacterium]